MAEGLRLLSKPAGSKELQIFIKDSAVKYEGSSNQPVTITRCSDPGLPRCDFQVSLRPSPTASAHAPLQVGSDEKIRLGGLGSRIMLLEFKGSKCWSRDDEVVKSVFKSAANRVLKRAPQIICKAQSSGDMRFEIVSNAEEEAAIGEQYLGVDPCEATTWNSVRGVHVTHVKMGHHLTLDEALQEATNYVYTHSLMKAEHQGDYGKLITGVMVITDTAPKEKVDEVFRLPTKMFGVWTGREHKSLLEGNVHAQGQYEHVPNDAFERQLKLWDPSAVVLSPSFFGMASFHLETTDCTPESKKESGRSICCRAGPGWVIITPAMTSLPLSPDSQIKTQITFDLMSTTEFSETFSVVPSKALKDDVPDDAAFEDLLPARADGVQHVLEITSNLSAVPQALSVLSKIICTSKKRRMTLEEEAEEPLQLLVPNRPTLSTKPQKRLKVFNSTQVGGPTGPIKPAPATVHLPLPSQTPTPPPSGGAGPNPTPKLLPPPPKPAPKKGKNAPVAAPASTLFLEKYLKKTT
jgi:hypothetical protein